MTLESNSTTAPLRGPLEAESPGVGRWRLLEPLGEGLLTEVFRAAPREHLAPSAACYAVKRLRPEHSANRAAVALLAREALVGCQIADPHLIAVLDWQLQERPYFLVMPQLVGTTLATRLELGGLPSLPEALWIARQAAQGLAALHRAGWMHADVKPANLFVAHGGHVTLLDLGFAHATDEPVNVAGRPVTGTLNYMAPEMLTSTLSADIRSDIYSLGVVLYELLTGRLPYEGRNPAEVAALQREGVPDRLRCLAPSLPLPVVKLVRRMLAKEPLRRPQTPAELVRELVKLEIATLRERDI